MDQAYQVKRVVFFGRSVKVCLQNENGPCPLLAIANVLSLRNELKLPSGCADISQSKLITMIVDLLLERNKQLEHHADFAADFQQNMADAFEVLQKLTTGIDVNVKFHSVFAFEPTKEVSVFDLLGIPLVHGWLVDPQDTTTTTVFRNKSYNELVEMLLLSLDGQEIDRLPSNLSLRSSSMNNRSTSQSQEASSLSASGGFSSATTHYLTNPPAASTAASSSLGTGDQRAVPGVPASATEQQQHLGPGTDLPMPRLRTVSASVQEGDLSEDTAIELLLEDMLTFICSEERPGKIELGESPTRTGSLSRKLAYHSPGPSRMQSSTSSSAESSAMGAYGTLSTGIPAAGVAPTAELEPDVPSTPPLPTAAGGITAAPAAAPGASAAGAAAADASKAESSVHGVVVRDFLETHATQLTPYGIEQLVESLKEHQLAVFFRNNHFNTLFKYESQVFLLVTDQGYAHESDIVWERLDSVAGDTSFFTGSFEPFVPHRDPASYSQAVAGTPYDTQYDAAVAASLAAAGNAVPGDHMGTEDADFALALQLQLQEEEALRERDRILASQQGQQQQGERQQGAPQQQYQQQQQQQRGMMMNQPAPSLQRAVLRQQQEKQQLQAAMRQQQLEEQQGRGRGLVSGRGRSRMSGGSGSGSAKQAFDEAKDKCTIM